VKKVALNNLVASQYEESRSSHVLKNIEEKKAEEEGDMTDRQPIFTGGIQVLEGNGIE